MKRKFTNNLARILGIITILTGTISVLNPIPLASASVPVAETLTDGSVMFIENVGQFDDSARFQVRGGNETIWLAEDGIWITLLETPVANNKQAMISISDPIGKAEQIENTPIQGTNIKLSFEGANPHPTLEPFNRIETTLSFFLGNDPEKWKSDVPVWGGVRYIDIYPGIDLEVASVSGQIMQELVIKEGGNLNAVRLQVEGAETIKIADGKLKLSTTFGVYNQPLFQVVGVDKRSLQHPSVFGDQVIAPFIVEQPRVATEIYPEEISALRYSTYLGGNSFDAEMDIALDTDGAIYIAGYSSSSDFPLTSGAFQTHMNDTWDGFVTKLNPEGNNLSFSTFFGGADIDNGIDIAIDANGASYVTGWTLSSDFPITVGAYDNILNSSGNGDAFLLKLAPDGSSLDFSTYLGGTGEDKGWGIAIDTSNLPTITGYTASTDFPTTSGVFDTTFNGDVDVFISKFNSDGSTLAYSTYLGGNGFEKGNDISINSNGEIYIAGLTSSASFPTTGGAYDTSQNGGNDVFLVKFSPDLSTQYFSTLLGGTNDDAAWGLAINSQGSAFITGSTASTNFPVNSSAFDTSFNGGDTFVSKVSSDGSSLTYSTFIGKSYDDWSGGYGIAIDNYDAAYISGFTDATDFPTTSDAFDTSLGGASDAFIVKLNPSGSSLLYASFLGGSGEERKARIGLDASGAVYVSGWTYSSDFPTTEGSFDTVYSEGNGRDIFVSKLMFNTYPETPDLISPSEGWISYSSTPNFLWNSVSNGDHYQIQISQLLDFTSLEQDVTLGTGVVTYTPTFLEDNLYYWRVRAIDVVGITGPWSVIRSFAIDTTPPATPDLISPIDGILLRNSSPSFSWSTVFDADHYQIQISSSVEFTTISQDVTLSPGISAYTATPLSDNRYYWRVRAIDLTGNASSWSSIQSFSINTTPLLPPEQISPINALVSNDDTQEFTWNSVIGADHYRIQISKVSDFSSVEQDIELSPELTTYTSDPLDDGIHYWRVRAIDSLNNQGNWSDVRTLTIDTVPPNPPLLAVPVPGYKVRGIPVTFEWSGWKDEVSFIFQYDDNSDFSSPIFTSDELTTESCTPPFQQIGISYYWHVKARDEAGNWSDWSSKASLLIYPLIPSPTTLISPENRLFTKDNTPTLSWSDVTDGYKYKVQISKTEDFSVIVQKSSIISPQLNEYTALPLVDGKYYWRVKSINVDGEKGPWSEIRKFTIDTVKPAAPILYKPVDGKIISGVPTYRWLAVSGARNYILSYSTNSAFTENVYLSPLLTDLFFTPISQDPMAYYWRVRAIDKAGNISKWSAVRKVIIE